MPNDDKLQVCRHEHPWIKHPVVEDADAEGNKIERVLERNALVSAGSITKEKFKKLKVGSNIQLGDKRLKVVRFLESPCPFLNQDNGQCHLSNPAKCHGCKVVSRYSDMDEVKNLGQVKVDKVKETKFRNFLENSHLVLLDNQEMIGEMIQSAKDLALRYAPYNKLTWDKLRRSHEHEVSEGLIDEDPDTHAIYKCNRDPDTGRNTRIERLGVLRANIGNAHELRRDLISIGSLLPTLSEYAALTARMMNEITTEGKVVRSSGKLEAEHLITNRLLPYRCTESTVESLMRSSDAYREIKDLEVRATQLNQVAWQLLKTLTELIQVIKHEIKSIETENKNVPLDY